MIAARSLVVSVRSRPATILLANSAVKSVHGRVRKEKPRRTRRGSSRSGPTLAIHPLPNKVRAGDNTEVASFALAQGGKRGAIQFLQVRQIQFRPEPAIDRRLHHLFQI